MSHITDGVILRQDVAFSYSVPSITVPDWATMITIDVYGNGSVNEINAYLYMRFNSDTGSNYNLTTKYYTTAYGYASTTGTYFTMQFLSTTENDGYSRITIYPKKDAAEYTQGFSSVMNPTQGPGHQHQYLRWLNSVDDVTSINLGWTVSTRNSISYIVRAYK